MLDLSRFTNEQRQPVLAGDGPTLIVAGPGSGKTTVLAARIAYLVAARGVDPTSILAITFATKAARELRSRLAGLLGDLGHRVDVSTFHAFGLRIIRQWSEELGLGGGPLTVYSADDALQALNEVARPGSFDLEDMDLAELAAAVERFRLNREDKNATPIAVSRVAEAYEDLLRRRGAVDYVAMLAWPLRLFAARSKTLHLYQHSYQYVLCDEFQDVCAPQYSLLVSLAQRHRNIMVVGDPRQTLYGWRGADVRFLTQFRNDFPETRSLSLDQNFRSVGWIVTLANLLGERLAYGHPLRTDNPVGEKPCLYLAEDEQAEAAFVATEVERLLAEGTVEHPGEVAILYRTNGQVDALALALKARHLPYRVQGGADLFRRREVRDAVAYLRLVHDPQDALALARIVNTPPRGLARVAKDLQGRPSPLSQLEGLVAAYGPAAVAAAGTLKSTIESLHVASSRLKPKEMLDLVLERNAYREWLLDRADGEDRLACLDTLRGLLTETQEELGEWLAERQLDEGVGTAPEDTRRVLLTTIHRAKGGEWRAVFVVGVEEGLLPHRRAFLSDAAAGIEDERRVAYVAVTRPRERLYLTCCRTRQRGERNERCHPSRFLQGLPVNLSERAA